MFHGCGPLVAIKVEAACGDSQTHCKRIASASLMLVVRILTFVSE
jgi:hypothetical protein